MTIGRCTLRELQHRDSLRDRRGGWMIVGSAFGAVVFMAAWLAVVG